jgi:hypothetical protein
MILLKKLFGKKLQDEPSEDQKTEAKKARIRHLENFDKYNEEIRKAYKETYGEDPITIKLSLENNYDSHFEYFPVTIFYNRDDLEKCLENPAPAEIQLFDLFELINAGNVAIYSELGSKMITEIKKEIYDNPLERRVRYYFPDGTRFIDVKTACKTP